MNHEERLRKYGKVVMSGDQLRKIESLVIEPKTYYDFTYATSSSATKLKKVCSNKVYYKGLGYVDEEGKPVIFNREDTLVIVDGSLEYLKNYELNTILHLLNYGVKVKLYYVNDNIKMHLSVINFTEVIPVDSAPEIKHKGNKKEDIVKATDEVVFEQINKVEETNEVENIDAEKAQSKKSRKQKQEILK